MFGGYRRLSFSRYENSYQQDNKAFLFSLTEKEVIRVKHNSSHAIYDHSNYLPTWGNGHHLSIKNQCLSTNANHSRFNCNTYSRPNSGFFFAEGIQFVCAEVEVFQILMNQ